MSITEGQCVFLNKWLETKTKVLSVWIYCPLCLIHNSFYHARHTKLKSQHHDDGHWTLKAVEEWVREMSGRKRILKQRHWWLGCYRESFELLVALDMVKDRAQTSRAAYSPHTASSYTAKIQ